MSGLGYNNIISTEDGEKGETDGSGSAETFWVVLEGFGFAQGVLAFVVFIFNRRTLRAFRKRAGAGATGNDVGSLKGIQK